MRRSARRARKRRRRRRRRRRRVVPRDRWKGPRGQRLRS